MKSQFLAERIKMNRVSDLLEKQQKRNKVIRMETECRETLSFFL